MDLHQEFRKLFRDVDARNGIAANMISLLPETLVETQHQTAQAFSDKWNQFEYGSPEFEQLVWKQKQWYLDLYGFSDESALAAYLQDCRLVLDAGAGMCYKAAWFAELSPSSLVVAADVSSSLQRAADYYRQMNNLFFVRCDIAKMSFFEAGLFDYVSCDQVIHHTADPFKTFQELVRVTGPGKELSVYVYRKKALPRELVDDYFRELSKTLDHRKLMEFSRQITELGHLLSSITVEIDFPDIPLLNIEGGRMPVQRFIYWNFLKCFWNEELGYQNSLMTNYDWYAPSQAFRYSEQEFRNWIRVEQLEEVYFHKENACYSGRFLKPSKTDGFAG
jgi:SAM-dependent methyltransferase